VKSLNYGNSRIIELEVDRGRTSMGYDLVIIYRILKYVRGNPGSKISELQKHVGSSFATLSKYVDFMEEKGLIESRGKKPRRIYITKKGLDYMFLISQIEHLLESKIE